MPTNTDTDRTDHADYKIFTGASGDQVVFGVSKLELGAALLPGAALWFAARQFVPPGPRALVYLTAIVWTLIGVSFVLAKEPWMNAREYVEMILRNYTHQNIMLYDRDPESSGIEQPTNDSILARIARLPGVSAIPYVGGAGSIDEKAEDDGRRPRAQDLVQFKRAYYGTPAIETDEGHLVGALRVEPANMVTAGPEAWERQVRVYAKILDTALSGSIQVVEYMRMVDYTPRIANYQERRSEIIATGDGLAPAAEIDYEDLPVGKKVHADLCEERAEVVTDYDLSTLVVDPYVIVEVKPEDVVGKDDIEGGLANVPLVGRAYKNLKLYQLRQSGEHVPEMKRLLEDRLDRLASNIQRLDGVGATVIPSTKLAQVAADHYQAANAYAYTDYESLVRQSPVVVPSEGTAPALDPEADPDYASDPEYELTYSHLDVEARRDRMDTLAKTHSRLAIAEKHAKLVAMDRESHGTPEPGETPDDPERPLSPDNPAEADVDGARTAEATDGGVDTQGPAIEWGSDTPAVDPGVVDVAVTDEELNEQFRSLLAPEEFDRSENEYVRVDRELYSATMFISEWPKNPTEGILETVIRFDDPEVAVNVATHIDVMDQQKAERELADLEDALKDKAERVEDSKFSMFADRYREEQQEASAMLRSFLASEHDMFEAQTYIEVQSLSDDALTRAIRSIKSKLSDEGARVTVLHRNHDRGYQTLAPACQDKIGQKVKMRADGLATTNAWTTQNLYEESGVEFGDNMATNEPMAADLFARDGGYNWAIVGKTGAGKTITSSEVIWRQKTLNPEMFVAVIDPLQEFANLAEIFGGERIVIGSTYLNPFDIAPTPEDKLDVVGQDAPYRQWVNKCVDFIELYYAAEGMSLRGKRGVWKQAIKKAGENYGIGENPESHAAEWRERNGFSGDCPTPLDAIDVIREMAEDAGPFVDDGGNEKMVAEREGKAIEIVNNEVEAFKPGGELEHLTHQTDVDLADVDFVYADLQTKEGDEEGGGLMMHLLLDLFYNEVKTRLERGMIFCDEFHYLLRDDTTVKSLNQKYRHHRHWDLSIGVGTQSHKDWFGTDSEGNVHLTDNAQVMLELTTTRIYQYVEGMGPEWADDLGLTPEETEIISELQKGNAAEGYSEALVHVDDEGCFPVRIVMDREQNPREATALMYDPSKHGEDYEEYLREHDDVCNWRWT
ncbi:VirB4 family type IV secretion system protein [Natronorarus salvus]|uniref:VirB4 family type IV secretion system protein n=1 Tax=Natronorarus salvus TaxID=3117733 RepID=UPI002F26738D